MQYVIDRLNLFINNNIQNKGLNYDIALYIRDHFNDVIHMNILELAENCHVSQPSITRFCKAMGYENFLHFKDECAYSILKRKENIEQKYAGLHYSSEEFTKDLTSVIDQMADSMHKTIETIDFKKIDQLAKAIYSAKNVYIIGVSFSNLAAQHLQAELSYLEKPIHLISDSIELNSVSQLNEEDLIISISLYHNLFSLEGKAQSYITCSSAKKYIITTIDDPSLVSLGTSIILYDSKDIYINRYLLFFVIDILISRFESIV